MILQTDEMEEVNIGGVRSMPSGIQAIAVTRGYDPGRAIKGLTSIEAGQEFVKPFKHASRYNIKFVVREPQTRAFVPASLVPLLLSHYFPILCLDTVDLD